MTSSAECAHVVLDVVPRVMQAIRAANRRKRDSGLSVLQLRALAYLYHQPGAPLSALAEHVGLTLPSMSSQVSGLVSRELVNRSVSTEDRRYVTLTLTEKGEQTFLTTLQRAEQDLAKKFEQLEPEERTEIVEALTLLTRIFNPVGRQIAESDALADNPAPDSPVPDRAEVLPVTPQSETSPPAEANPITNDVAVSNS